MMVMRFGGQSDGCSQFVFAKNMTSFNNCTSKSLWWLWWWWWWLIWQQILSHTGRWWMLLWTCDRPKIDCWMFIDHGSWWSGWSGSLSHYGSWSVSGVAFCLKWHSVSQCHKGRHRAAMASKKTKNSSWHCVVFQDGIQPVRPRGSSPSKHIHTHQKPGQDCFIP